jgi:CDP-glycerol glycerophosphotransferase (TagB/SpsB family)
MPRDRFGFLCCHAYQRAILEPTFQLLAPDHDCLLTMDAEALIAFAPDVIVQSEGSGTICMLRERLPRSAIVHTRHGLACKKVAHEAARHSDYTCQSSEWLAAWFTSRGTRPRRRFWITGYPALDPLFRAAHSTRSGSGGRPRILYAPTYNEHLSSVGMLGLRAFDLLTPDGNEARVTIKPHPHTAHVAPGWLAAMRREAARREHAHVADPQSDITDCLVDADVLVTDVSSVALAYLALDRPIVLLTNPDAPLAASHFEPEGLEWQWRDMGEEIQSAVALPRVLATALEAPNRRSSRRTAYRELLFGELTDGRSGERLALALVRAAHEGTYGGGRWF